MIVRGDLVNPRRVGRRRSLRSAIVVFAAAILAPAAPLEAAKPVKVSPAEDWPAVTDAERALKRVEADPEADAVILSKERNGQILEMGDGPINVLTYHWRAKILTERGRGLAEVRIPALKSSRVSSIVARTIKSNGTIVPVAPEQIFEKVVRQIGDVTVSEFVFNFAAVEPGAIIEYRYARFDNSILYIDPFYFADTEYTLRSRVTQAVPGRAGYSILCDFCDGTPEVTPWPHRDGIGSMYAIALQNVPPWRRESLMPPARDVTPRLEMVLHSWRDVYWTELARRTSLFTDWESVAKFFDFRYRVVIKEGSRKLEPLVQGWLAGATEPNDKVMAILRHVRRDFRYFEYDYVNGRVPSFESLLKDKAADNEGKAVLMVAALKIAGLDGRVALVSGKHRGSLNPKFFSPSQFSHAIVVVPREDGTLQWFDPNVTHAPSAFMPWRDSGADALVIEAGGVPRLTTVPVKHEESLSRYKVTVTPGTGARAVVAVEAEWTGEDAIDLRDAFVLTTETERKESLQRWVAGRLSGAELREHAFEDLDDPEKPLRARFTIETPGLLTLADEVLLVRGCVLTCQSVNPLSRSSRQHPFYVDRGWSLDETVIIATPQGKKSVPPTLPMTARSVVGSLSFSCAADGEASVRCTRLFNARRNRWPASQSASIRAMFDKIVEADRTTVAFEPAEAAGASSGR